MFRSKFPTHEPFKEAFLDPSQIKADLFHSDDKGNKILELSFMGTKLGSGILCKNEIYILPKLLSLHIFE